MSVVNKRRAHFFVLCLNDISKFPVNTGESTKRFFFSQLGFSREKLKGHQVGIRGPPRDVISKCEQDRVVGTLLVLAGSWTTQIVCQSNFVQRPNQPF